MTGPRIDYRRPKSRSRFSDIMLGVIIGLCLAALWVTL